MCSPREYKNGEKELSPQFPYLKVKIPKIEKPTQQNKASYLMRWR